MVKLNKLREIYQLASYSQLFLFFSKPSCLLSSSRLGRSILARAAGEAGAEGEGEGGEEEEEVDAAEERALRAGGEEEEGEAVGEGRGRGRGAGRGGEPPRGCGGGRPRHGGGGGVSGAAGCAYTFGGSLVRA